ncbi:MAG: diguanylate cyclase domain-containing protein [Myxococcota bacterium]
MSDAMTAQADPLHYGSQQTTMLGHLVRLPPTPPIESITKLVSQEPLLCEKLVDSLYTHRRAPTITPAVVHQCVNSLGADVVRRLMLVHTVWSLLSGVDVSGYSSEAFLLESLRRAFIAEELAVKMDYKDPMEAFLGGLLSDFGSLLIAIRYPHLRNALSQLRHRHGELREDIERICTGTSHSEEFSRGKLAKLIPPRILQAILRHHRAFPGEDRQAQLTSIIGTADNIADIGQAGPKSFLLERVKEQLALLKLDVKIETIYESADAEAYLLMQRLGFSTEERQPYYELFELPKPTTQQDSFDDLMLHLTAERTLESYTQFIEGIQDSLSSVSMSGAFTLLLVDIDNFQKVNAAYGYPTGDTIIQNISQQIVQSMRMVDRVAHIGGERFALLLPRTQKTGGKVVAERVRSLVKHGNLTLGMLRIQVSVSIGGRTLSEEDKGLSAQEVWSQLVDAINTAKRQGRNRASWHTN